MTQPTPLSDPPERLDRLAGAFRMGHDSDDAEADLTAMVNALDLQDSLPSIRRLRRWSLRRLAPRDGETALDVGSGTGTVLRALAALVGPSGRAVGVEPHPRPALPRH